MQYVGRLHWPHPGKTEVRICDYVDREVSILARMFEKRPRGYRALDYAHGSAPLTRDEMDNEALASSDMPATAGASD